MFRQFIPCFGRNANLMTWSDLLFDVVAQREYLDFMSDLNGVKILGF